MGRCFGRYVVNVRKIPMRMPKFISVLTDARKDIIMEHIDEFDGKDVGSEAHREYHTALYVITRILKPDIIVETGTFHGSSSFAILSAMQDNNKGFLYSIDLPSSKLPHGKEPGWLVSNHLRDRWDLRLGRSYDVLPDLLKEIGEIDAFLHDRKHTYENMYWEYETAWNNIRAGGLLLSHDISRNLAFRDFAKNVSENYWYMLKNFAGMGRRKCR